MIEKIYNIAFLCGNPWLDFILTLLELCITKLEDWCSFNSNGTAWSCEENTQLLCGQSKIKSTQNFVIILCPVLIWCYPVGYGSNPISDISYFSYSVKIGEAISMICVVLFMGCCKQKIPCCLENSSVLCGNQRPYLSNNFWLKL